jgi:hypothetical protein
MPDLLLLKIARLTYILHLPLALHLLLPSGSPLCLVH